MAEIIFDDVTIAHGKRVVLRDVSLTISDGEFVAVVGPSGSGKTTLVRTIAGFTDVLRGRLLLDGVDITNMKTAQRDVGMVFQEPVLFGNRTVRRNVSFPLEIQRQGAEEINRRVNAEVRALHVEHLLTRRPSELSRGESQLVQIARAMVRIPRVLLLDEPLASLDARLQSRMRTELKMLQAGYGVTTVMTTNDPADAVTMPGRLVVIDGGRVVQVDDPAHVRRSPSTVDAAVATGDCWMLPALVETDGRGFWLAVQRIDGTVVFRHRAWAPALADRIGEQVTLGIRPDDVRVDTNGPVSGRVVRTIAGSSQMLMLDVGGRRLGVHHRRVIAPGERINVSIDHVAVFDTTSGRAIT